MHSLRAVWPVLLVACALFAWNAFDVYYVQDDAYITLVHARNLVAGNGPVFNPGENVEGYTSPAWMLVSAAVLLLTNAPMDVLQLLGLLCGLVIVVLVSVWSWHLLSHVDAPYRRLLAGLAGSLVAITPAFAYWCGSGMETGLFLAVVLAAVMAQQLRPDSMLWSWLTAVAIVIRPEAMLMLAVLGAWHIVRARTLLPILPPLLTLVALTAWRVAYYGAWLPNTFAAKTPGIDVQLSDGFTYLIAYLQHLWIGGFGIIAVGIGAWHSRKHNSAAGIALAALWLIAVVFLGGDVLRHQRLFLPVFVITAPFLVVGIHSIARRFLSWPWTSTVVAGLALAFVGYSERASIQQSIHIEGELVSKMSRLGAAIRSIGTAQQRPLTIAASTIGALAWSSRSTVIDMLGLTDRTIATSPHIIDAISATPGLAWKERKYNARYVLDRKPDYIIFSTGIKPSAYAERALLAEGMFAEYYQYYVLVAGSADMQLVFRRKPKEVLQRMQPSNRPELMSSTSWIAAYATALDELRQPDLRGAALQHLEELASVVPQQCSWIHQQLGDAAFERGNHDQAFDWYAQALRRDPCDIRSHFGMFQLARLRKDAEAARLHGDWVTRCNPKLFRLLGIDVPDNVY
jgi:arabinofuranosyltransferase